MEAGEKELLIFISPTLGFHPSIGDGIYEDLKVNFGSGLVSSLNRHYGCTACTIAGYDKWQVEGIEICTMFIDPFMRLTIVDRHGKGCSGFSVFDHYDDCFKDLNEMTAHMVIIIYIAQCNPAVIVNHQALAWVRA